MHRDFSPGCPQANVQLCTGDSAPRGPSKMGKVVPTCWPAMTMTSLHRGSRGRCYFGSLSCSQPAACVPQLGWPGAACSCLRGSQEGSPACCRHGARPTPCLLLQGRTALEGRSSRSAAAGCPPPMSSTTGVCWSESLPVRTHAHSPPFLALTPGTRPPITLSTVDVQGLTFLAWLVGPGGCHFGCWPPPQTDAPSSPGRV